MIFGCGGARRYGPRASPTTIFRTKNSQTKNIWVKISNSLR